jgi:hypothetical protein
MRSALGSHFILSGSRWRSESAAGIRYGDIRIPWGAGWSRSSKYEQRRKDKVSHRRSTGRKSRAVSPFRKPGSPEIHQNRNRKSLLASLKSSLDFKSFPVNLNSPMQRGPVSTMSRYAHSLGGNFSNYKEEYLEESSEELEERPVTAKKSPVILRRTADVSSSLQPIKASRYLKTTELHPAESSENKWSTKSTHRRPAFADSAVPSRSSVPKQLLATKPYSPMEIQSLPELQISDLKSNLQAYDGTPIYIVPKIYYDLVAQSFTAGMYGLDTESDYDTGDLRILQIYTGTKVYIFPVDVLDRQLDNYFIKFLKSKDRIKVGVDIDGDAYRIKKYVQTRRHMSHVEQNAKYKFTVNGTIDVQSVARSFNEQGFSLEKLAFKYVEDFQGNPSDFGDYLHPTPNQYIYAANDAILSLKIYFPLVHREPCFRWQQLREVETAYQEASQEPLLLEEQKTSEKKQSSLLEQLADEQEVCPISSYNAFRAFVFPLVVAKTPRKLSKLLDHIVKEVKRWPAMADDEVGIRETSTLFLENMYRVKFLDVYEPAADKIWIKTPETVQTDSEIPEADPPASEAKSAPSSKRKKKGRKGQASDNKPVIIAEKIPDPVGMERQSENIGGAIEKDTGLTTEEKRLRLRERIKEVRSKRNAGYEDSLKVIALPAGHLPKTVVTSISMFPTARVAVGFKERLQQFKNEFDSFFSEDKIEVLRIMTKDFGLTKESSLEESIKLMGEAAETTSDEDYYKILSDLCALCNAPEYKGLHTRDKPTTCFRRADVVNIITDKLPFMATKFPNYQVRFLVANSFISLACDNHHLCIFPN